MPWGSTSCSGNFALTKGPAGVGALLNETFYSRIPNTTVGNPSFFDAFPSYISVSSVVEFPGAGSSRLRTINSELNGAT